MLHLKQKPVTLRLPVVVTQQTFRKVTDLYWQIKNALLCDKLILSYIRAFCKWDYVGYVGYSATHCHTHSHSAGGSSSAIGYGYGAAVGQGVTVGVGVRLRSWRAIFVAATVSQAGGRGPVSARAGMAIQKRIMIIAISLRISSPIIGTHCPLSDTVSSSVNTGGLIKRLDKCFRFGLSVFASV